MRYHLILPFVVITYFATSLQLSAQIEIESVRVGNSGNYANRDGLGGVEYEFYVSKFEITNEQYVAFLNAVAVEDPNELFRDYMEIIDQGIVRMGLQGSYSYYVKSGDEDKPVVGVTFWSAARFANWLSNGQPSGPQDESSTESGVYILGGVLSPPIEALVRNEEAIEAGGIHLLSEDEWYKAAFFDPTLALPPSNAPFRDWYWNNATRSNLPLNTNRLQPDPGNSANLLNPQIIPDRTDVGTFENSTSYFGTFDQNGNANEWTDTVRDGRVVHRGGGYTSSASNGRAFHGTFPPEVRNNVIGIRLGSRVPIGSATLGGSDTSALEAEIAALRAEIVALEDQLAFCATGIRPGLPTGLVTLAHRHNQFRTSYQDTSVGSGTTSERATSSTVLTSPALIVTSNSRAIAIGGGEGYGIRGGADQKKVDGDEVLEFSLPEAVSEDILWAQVGFNISTGATADVRITILRDGEVVQSGFFTFGPGRVVEELSFGVPFDTIRFEAVNLSRFGIRNSTFFLGTL